MIIINPDEFSQLEKYYDIEPTEEVVSNLVDDLAEIIGKASGQDIEIYQDYDDSKFYRLYAGSSAAEVYVVDNVIQIDFDVTFKITEQTSSYVEDGDTPQCQN